MAIDEGRFHISDQRAVFMGAKQTREWAWAKLIGIAEDDHGLATFLAVSNRQKTSGISYDHQDALLVRFFLALGVARFNGTAEQMRDEMLSEWQDFQNNKPKAPLPS
jgi:hypothetical protein